MTVSIRPHRLPGWMGALVLAVSLAFALPAAAALTFPPLTGRVVDSAHVLSPATQAALTAKLAALEQKNGDQLVVVTLSTLQNQTIEDYGYQLGRAWGIGEKGKNNGALFIIERAAYSPPPDALIDDLYVSMQALLGGKRVVSAQSVLVAERGAVSWTEEFDRKARIACQGINVHRTLWPKLVKAPPVILYCYLSHRFLKWLTPFNLLFTGLFVYLGLAFKVGPALPTLLASLAFIVLTLGAVFDLPYCRTIAAALAALVGVATGLVEALLMGRTYTNWSPAPSVRDDG